MSAYKSRRRARLNVFRSVGLLVLILAQTACGAQLTSLPIVEAERDRGVNALYLEPTDSVGLPTAINEYVVCGNVNIRPEPKAEGRVLGWLKIGQSVNVIEISNGWARIKNGYVNARYLCPKKE